MRKAIALALLAVLPASGAPDRRDDSYHRTIFFAVLEGLYEDGVATEDVELILRRDPGTRSLENFVYACPICNPARDAFEVYRSRPMWRYKLTYDTFGKGLDAETHAALWGGDRAARLTAIEGLVRKWVGRRLALMRLSDEERSAYEHAFESMRKEGMSQLKDSALADEKRCAMCDGAFRAAGGK
ncbi:MAG: hypothetical protein ACHQ1G_06625 [Planctomycetota bacterium]